MMIYKDGSIRPMGDVPFDMPDYRADIEFPELNVLNFDRCSIFLVGCDLTLQDLNRYLVPFRLSLYVGAF